MKILLLSDTHSYVDEKICNYAHQVDEIWHCGDFGSMNVVKTLQAIKPLRGVYGNIDGIEIRTLFPEINRFTCEEVDVLMLHIGGYPNKYTTLAKEEITKQPPKLFISGHSHILKVMFDKQNKLLHLNPGAAGKQGWQKVHTFLLFEINGEKIENLNIVEMPL